VEIKNWRKVVIIGIISIIVLACGMAPYGYWARKDTFTGESWKEVRAKLKTTSWITVIDGKGKPSPEASSGYIYARKGDDDDKIYIWVNFEPNYRIEKLSYKRITGNVEEIPGETTDPGFTAAAKYEGKIGAEDIALTEMHLKSHDNGVTVIMSPDQFRKAFLEGETMFRAESEDATIDFVLESTSKRYVEEFGTKAGLY
jgi:hypothetical protein